MTINETLKMLPPEAKKEVADFVEFIAQKYLKKKSKTNQAKRKLLNFAGTWKDMDEEDYQNFISEVYERRQRAFAKTRHNHSCEDKVLYCS